MCVPTNLGRYRVSDQRETLGFQTEVRQLLQLMIHSLYSNKEIFLRELISNASDAADKLRFEALASPKLQDDDADLGIAIEIDKEKKTLSVVDNGIGMSLNTADNSSRVPRIIVPSTNAPAGAFFSETFNPRSC